MRNSIASRRDKGDITPTSMMRLVVQTFLELKAKQDAAGLQTFFLDMASELSADMASAKSNAEVFLSALNAGRDEGTILSAQASLRSSLAGSYDKVRQFMARSLSRSHYSIFRHASRLVDNERAKF